MVSASVAAGGTERVTQRQISSSDELAITREATEVVLIPPETGVLDFYQESIFFTDPVPQRNGNFVDLVDDYGVVQRNGNIVYVSNAVYGQADSLFGSYTVGNAGPNIGHFDTIANDGFCGVSGYTLGQMDLYAPTLSIKDFTDRATSNYTISGTYFNLTRPSIQNPVAISSSAGTIGGSIVVQDTTFFPTTGYLFTSNGSVIQYTGKTSTSFTGCTLTRGPNVIANGHELIPFAIS